MVVVAENNYFKNNKYPPTHTSVWKTVLHRVQKTLSNLTRLPTGNTALCTTLLTWTLRLIAN